MKNFFSLQYWFAPLPGSPDLRFWRILFMVSAALLVFWIISLVFVARNKHDGLRRRVWSKYAIWSFTVSLVTYVFGFFRFQQAQFLSMRAWIFLWIVFSCLWFVLIVKYVALEYPKKLKARQERERLDKYLPHKR